MKSSFVIAGIGTALPELSMSQEDAGAAAALVSDFTVLEQRKLKQLYRSSGVNTRRSVLFEPATDGRSATQSFYQRQTSPTDGGPTTAQRMQRYEQAAPDLAVEAASLALQQADIPARRATHLVTVSCSGFSAPGVDLALIDQLGLSRGIARTHVGFMGCHGALNGLRVAHAFAAADPEAVVLLCAVELCSLHHNYGWHPDRLVANALFADGAAAAVGFSREGQAGTQWRLAANGSLVLPDTADLMSWRIGDHGFEMSLSAQVPHTIQSSLRPWMEAWLTTHNLTLADIKSWAVHPGGPRILSAVDEALGLGPAALAPSREMLAQCGNLSSPTVLFIVKELQRNGAPRPCVSLGFGPGLAVEAALFV
ncbi:MAG: Alpha-pyrone synthesis polyketide synthase-like Pks18 [Planctomycetaceae bacterium]|nr:Alpha-pyrone synthesis polyketide synthase-like Pks18 [Planctomycetaceae bacterium]